MRRGMESIFQVNEHDVPWASYENARGAIRYKALTAHAADVPPVQYVEYAAGHADPMHSHQTGEFLVVTDGELWLDDARGGPRSSGPGSVVFIPRGTEYSVRGGDEGVRFLRVVVP
jgi:quercetin dioxygenase-like cupin family protein